MQNNFQVIIIGGSYAGLSAAMALGRSLRTVLIIDSGSPCNKQTPHSHNFITQDGVAPAVIAAKAKAEVLRYKTIQYKNGQVNSLIKNENTFEIKLLEGETYSANKVILANGIKDVLPNIKGFAPCWGISLIHCPYCHGYEVKGAITGILANSDRAIHLASMVKNLTQHVTIFTNGQADFTQEQKTKLLKNNVPIVEKEITEFVHLNGYINKIIFADNSTMAVQAMYVNVPFEQHKLDVTNVPVELTELGYIKVDMFQKTTVTGLFACGDNCTMMRTVSMAVATGTMAGAMVNMELVAEVF